MKSAIAHIATTTLALLISYTTHPVFAVAQTTNQPVPVAQAKKLLMLMRITQKITKQYQA